MINSRKRALKHVVYMLLFACLFGIDVVVGSVSQAIWLFTNNFTGIVAALIMFTAYSPREFMKPFYIIYSILGFIASVGGIIFWYAHQVGHTFAFWMTVPLNIWFLGMAVFKILEKWLIKKEIKVTIEKWEIVFAVCMLLMLLSKSADIWPLYYLIIFEALWHTPFEKEDRKNLLWGMIDGVILGFFLVQSFAYYNRPYDVARYHGSYGDSNRNSCMYLVAMAGFLSRSYMLRVQQRDSQSKWTKFHIVMSWMFAAAMGSFIFFTGCRTAMFGVFVMVVVYVLLSEGRTFHMKRFRIFFRSVAYAAVMVAAVPVVYLTIRYIPAICDHPLYYGVGWTIDSVQPRSAIDDARYISFEEAMQELLGRLFLSPFTIHVHAAEKIEDSASDYIRVEYWLRKGEPDESYGEYSIPRYFITNIPSVDIRIQIYYAYLHNMNLTGHRVQDGYYEIKPENAAGFKAYNAQNVIIYLLFAYGIPTGILACVLLVYVLLVTVKRFLKGRYDCLVYLLFFIAFWMMGTQEVVWIPGQIVLFMLFFVIHFLRDKETDYTTNV